MKHILNISTLLLIFGITSCLEQPDPQMIVDEAIKVHGGKLFEDVKVDFTFRKIRYSLTQQDGRKLYTREFSDSTRSVRDELYNSSEFKRYVNDTLMNVDKKMAGRYSESINSVNYFFQLPYGLNDAAVQKEYLGEVYIFKTPYHKIKVTFKQEDGGVDYQDVFIYWIHRDEYTLDYLAYSYQTNGGGTRFRQAINRRTIDGIIVQDYINFKGESKNLPIEKHDDYFEKGELKELSRIINEDVVITKKG